MQIGSRLAKWPQRSQQRERPQVGEPPLKRDNEPPSQQQYYAQRRLLKLATKRRQSKLKPDRLPRKDAEKFYKDLLTKGIPLPGRVSTRRTLFSPIPQGGSSDNDSRQDEPRQASLEKSPGFQRAVIPKIAACRTWRRLHKKIVPKYIFGFDSTCTSYFYRNLGRLYPQRTDNTRLSEATQAALASSRTAVIDARSPYHDAALRRKSKPRDLHARECASYELMVRAAGVVVTSKLQSLNTKALVSISVGLGHTGIRDLPVLREWELAVGYKLNEMIGDQLVAVTCALGHLAYIPSLQFMAAFFTTLGRKLRTMNLFWLTMLCKGLSLMLQASTGDADIPETEAVVRLLQQRAIVKEQVAYVPPLLEVPPSCVSQILLQIQKKLSQLQQPQTTHSLAPAVMVASLCKAARMSAYADSLDCDACQSMGISEEWLVWYLTYLQTNLESKRWHLKPLEVCSLLEFSSEVHSVLLASTHAEREHLLQQLSSVTQLTCASACFTFCQHAVDGATSKRMVAALLGMKNSPGAPFISALLKSSEKNIAQLQASEGAWIVHGLFLWKSLPLLSSPPSSAFSPRSSPPSSAEPWMAAMFVVTRSQLHGCSVNELIAYLRALSVSQVHLPQVWVNALLRDIHDRLQQQGPHARKQGEDALDEGTKARLAYLLQMVPSCRKVLKRSFLRAGCSMRVGSRLTALESEYLLDFLD